MIDGFDDVERISRDSVSRTLRSLDAVSRGWQMLVDETAGYSRQAFKDGTAYVENLLGADSVDAALKTQTQYLRVSSAKAVGQAARFSEIYLDVATEVARPFQGTHQSAST
jgi:hypothetical protein